MGGAKLEKKRNKKSTWVDSYGLKEVLDSENFDGVKKQKLIQKEVVEVVATHLKKKQMGKGADEPGKADFGLVEETRNNRDESVEKRKVKKLRKEHPKTGSKVEDVIQSAATESEGLAVIVSGSGWTNPKFKSLASFAIPGVPGNVLACCKKFHKPFPIQAHAWPFLLAGRDSTGVARTGSDIAIPSLKLCLAIFMTGLLAVGSACRGKTLAFGVPAVVHVLNKKVKLKKPSPLALVLAPTRELTQQMIIVATPGRLQDLLEKGVCSLDLVSFVVLDKADRMLDLGFEPAIRAILNVTPASRQTLMFSATWPVSVDNIGKDFLQDSSRIVKVTVGSEDLAANHDVTQIVEVVDEKDRIFRLESLLRKYHKSRINRVIVFVLYKKEAAWVEGLLQNKGWKAVAVHGDKGQSDRTQAVKSFKDGSCPLLVATDVAARGLDIPDVEYVINFSFPLTIEDCVHRIGRTGRAGKKGTAHTFFTQTKKARAGELVNVLTEAGQNVSENLLKFGTRVKKKESSLYGAHFKEIGASAKQSTKTTFGNSDDDD